MRIAPTLRPWIAFGLFAALCYALRDQAGWIVKYPTPWVIPLEAWLNVAMDWFVAHFQTIFRGISWAMEWPMTGIQATLHWLPWPVTIAIFTAIAHRAGGWKLAAFTLGSLLYMLITGYWFESMNTLALVGVSVPLSVAIGFGLGILSFRSNWAWRIVDPMLDLMQTVPAFAYLIPILLLFGFGPVVGLIASAIYAAPPMVRNTMLGLQRVPSDIRESGLMSGCTPRQSFWWVEVPTALPQILVGVNQTTMAALSMVIIAAIIGGFGDIGWEVLSTMRKAQFGQSLLAGIVIAIMAMIMDRVTRGLTDRERNLAESHTDSSFQRHRHLIVGGGAAVAFLVLAHVVAPLKSYPESWIVHNAVADWLNHGIDWFVANYSAVTDGLKNSANFFVLLPLRIGLLKAVYPKFWGFAMTPEIAAAYWIGMVALAAWCFWRGRQVLGIIIAIAAPTLFWGLEGMPWPVFIGLVGLVAYLAGGLLTTVFVVASFGFMLVNGLWAETMRSVYLCGAAVLLCFLIGGALGVWAAGNDRVSAAMRPINDTLQTMPQFVILIPVLMFFAVGEFSALLAVIIYAIVPPIRYVEHGLRNVRPDVVEAAKQIGCTDRQILFDVKLPLALPVIMLGLNQTIMYGLAMLVIAALVGTKGLGQAVYLALGKANAGMGLVAGLSIALVAMSADRILQAWSRRKRKALGL
ncbi:ABC transporter permease subunit [Rhodospirillaceae bacterium KN72]|uniref:ABC transporter permease subunit n=1 Tax=Pacificispira spongiicola TaxID=2729598 RepID=A0A7Y0E0F7_9PROT|nr:ABC transporter permease subunit [Pacificispira spongiicola]NMM44838.1 ABC transporter permease subunit [Pacificispira spongiicola]